MTGNSLDRSEDYYLDCELCSYCTFDKKIVYARCGNNYDNLALDYYPDIMVISETVTQDIEQEMGLPILGDTGILLENMLNSIGLTSHDVYITVAVKCKFEGKLNNNNFNTCVNAHLLYQIEKVKPKVIVTLGSKISEFTINQYAKEKDTKFKITQDRGKIYQCENFVIVPTYSLSYLLRNHALADGSKKHQVWQDLKTIATCLHLPSLL